MDSSLDHILPTPKMGTEPFHQDGTSLGVYLLDFWRWSESDLLSNALRGIIAEYIVANALGLTEEIREEWRAYDLKTADGIAIEVKSCAYLQSWKQKRYSPIKFTIKPTRAWNPTIGDYEGEPRRQAQIYIFCLFHHKDKPTAQPLDVSQWTFYILRTSVLEQYLPFEQKEISLTRLLDLKPACTNYDELNSSLSNIKRELFL